MITSIINSVFEDIALSEDNFTDQGFIEEGRLQGQMFAQEQVSSGERKRRKNRDCDVEGRQKSILPQLVKILHK